MFGFYFIYLYHCYFDTYTIYFTIYSNVKSIVLQILVVDFQHVIFAIRINNYCKINNNGKSNKNNRTSYHRSS